MENYLLIVQTIIKDLQYSFEMDVKCELSLTQREFEVKLNSLVLTGSEMISIKKVGTKILLDALREIGKNDDDTHPDIKK